MHDLIKYFNAGWHHITDFRGLDHILLVTALCVRYLFTDWKKVVILITAFTIGHAITMTISVFDIFQVSARWLQFLIPFSIIVAAISNLFVKKFVYRHKYPPVYFLALLFGLIHGFTFTSFFIGFSGTGKIILKIIGFVIGIEAGQLLVVLAILLLTFVCINIFKVNRREYILFLSGGVLAVALQMALQRVPF
ncbi:HupE/UreJ family protein [Segetibacter aerophilus]|uniref:HupE / UreJ protein n=1 Tax=Segetibacter aerophilus TaxID=670293 RepID=A0A512B7M2_9BACT|nr:HupE/UreJ family protein [Segetibacter aerophilus]GEO07955.1 hypothetical protein SAE01_04510 [Segetibacter aerophilus]